MSKITIDRDEFVYLVMSFLLDNILHEDEMIIDNEDWKFIMEKIKLGGLKAHLMQAYVRMDTERRVDYKRIKKVFYEESKTQYVIGINGTPDLKEDTLYKYKMKDMIREVVRLIMKEKEKTGFTVSSEKVDRMVEEVVKKQQQFEE
jgi:hypothetical protein